MELLPQYNMSAKTFIYLIDIDSTLYQVHEDICNWHRREILTDIQEWHLLGCYAVGLL
jgi:hypothetical protein